MNIDRLNNLENRIQRCIDKCNSAPSFTVNPDYRYFVLNLSTGKIVSGWEYRADALFSMNEFNEMSDSYIVLHFNSSNYANKTPMVKFATNCIVFAVNPFDSANWGWK